MVEEKQNEKFVGRSFFYFLLYAFTKEVKKEDEKENSRRKKSE